MLPPDCISAQSYLYFSGFPKAGKRCGFGYLNMEAMLEAVRPEYKRLVKEALDAKKRSYAPYSHFHVGAALLTTTGKIFRGCNVEISTYALTICAERTAIFKAISEGDKNFKAIAVVSDDPGYTPPCGACRQVLMDLAGNIDFLMINGKGSVRVVKMRELLPHAFGQKNLERTRKTHR